MKENKGIKKWGFVLSFIFILMMLPSKVFASANLSLSGVSSFAPGETISIDVNISSADQTKFTGFEGALQYDSKVFTLSSITPAAGWSGTNDIGESGKEIKFTSDGKSGNFKLATIKFKVGSNVAATSGSISINSASLIYKDDDGNDTRDSLTNQSKTLDIKSSDATLKSIKVNGVSLEGFASNNTDYKMDVPSKTSTLKINATPTNSKATFKAGFGDRTVNLKYGDNEVKIIVVSETGTTKTYKITVTREDTRSDDSSLKSIAIDGEDIKNFRENTLNYSVKKYKTNKVVVTAVANDKAATVKVEGPKTLEVGDNKFTITVTSENGEKTIYTLTVQNIESAINKKLKNLSISGYDIDFDKNNNRYEIAYNKTKFKKLRIYYTTIAGSDEVETVITPDVNNDKDALEKLEVGDVISIKITGIDGESVEYTIEIVKDKRINFFFVLEVSFMILIAIVILVVFMKRKNNKNKPKKKDTTVVKKVPEKAVEKTTKVAATKVEKADKPKKKRFSIFEDEYEEVEVEVDDEDTIELSQEDLNLK